MGSKDCKLHQYARALALRDPKVPNAMGFILSDDPDARRCGGCNPSSDPGQCDVDRTAILWAEAERWEQRFHAEHRPHSAQTLLETLHQMVARDR